MILIWPGGCIIKKGSLLLPFLYLIVDKTYFTHLIRVTNPEALCTLLL